MVKTMVSAVFRTYASMGFLLTVLTFPVYASCVVECQVENALASPFLLGESVTLRWNYGGKQPIGVYDFGGKTVGGYAVFRVTDFSPQGVDAEGRSVGYPVLRLSYATHPDGLRDTGDFKRRCCIDYLGPQFDNPVLPANVNRFELYTISRKGVYVAPLVQGQERYVRMQLETPGTSVSIDSFEIRNVGVFSKEEPVGTFMCSDERINRSWEMSAWTCRIAAIPNNDAWRVVAGQLLPRKLERGSFSGFSKTKNWYGDGVLGADFELRKNPHFASAFGLVFRASDDDDGVLVIASQPGFIRIMNRHGGHNYLMAQKVVDEPIADGAIHRLEARILGTAVEAIYDGVKIVEAKMPMELTGGKFGFYTEKEWWPVVRSVSVRDASGKVLFSDDFSAADKEGRLPGWDYTRSFRFLADGAKRDRLAWLGDLWWAQRTVYAAYDPTWPYLTYTLRLFAYYQTPEGYVWAAPFSEKGPRPQLGEYGHFPSDEFTAWMPTVVWDHYLYTGDRGLLQELYPAVQKLLEYLQTRCAPDGTFVQRLETSSNMSSMAPVDTSMRCYTHFVIWKAFFDGARLAMAIGNSTDATRWSDHAQKMAAAVRANFWNEDEHEFRAKRGQGRGSSWTRAMALAARFATHEEAGFLARRIPLNGASKCHLLALRGLFEYGYDEAAFQMIEGGSWFKLSDPSWKGAQCCTECGFLVRDGFWDESHPDTTVAGPITTYLLGIEPVEPGFARFRFAPHVVKRLSFAHGTVPTPKGIITASWTWTNDVVHATLDVPVGTFAEVAFPRFRSVVVDANPVVAGAMLKPGIHDIIASDFDSAALPEPVSAVISEGARESWHEAPPFNRCRDTNQDATFVQTVDLGSVRSVLQLEWTAGCRESFPSQMKILCSFDGDVWSLAKEQNGLDWPGCGKKTLIDLHTAGANQEARYVRLSMKGPTGIRDKDGTTYYFVDLPDLRIKCGD